MGMMIVVMIAMVIVLVVVFDDSGMKIKMTVDEI